MNVAYLNTPGFSFFCDATKQINHMITHLQFAHCRDNEHGDIEQYIQKEGTMVSNLLLLVDSKELHPKYPLRGNAFYKLC